MNSIIQRAAQMARSSSDILRNQSPSRWATMGTQRRNQEVRAMDRMRNAQRSYAQFDNTPRGWATGGRNAIMNESPETVMGGVMMGNRQQAMRQMELGLDPVVNAAQDRRYELRSRDWQDRERERATQNWQFEDKQRAREQRDWAWEDEKQDWQRSMWDRANKAMGTGGSVSVGGNYRASGLR